MCKKLVLAVLFVMTLGMNGTVVAQPYVAPGDITATHSTQLYGYVASLSADQVPALDFTIPGYPLAIWDTLNYWLSDYQNGPHTSPASGNDVLQWVRYDFASPQTIGEMIVWNGSYPGFPDRACKDVQIYYSSDSGATWTKLTSREWAETSAVDGVYMPATDSVTFPALTVDSVVVDIISNWGGYYEYASIREVLFDLNTDPKANQVFVGPSESPLPTLAEAGEPTSEFDVFVNPIDRSYPPKDSLTVTVTPDSQLEVNGAGAGVAVNLTFDTADPCTPQTVTVNAVDDAIAEGDHTGTISFSSSCNDPNYDGLTITPLTYDILDDDAASVRLSTTSLDVAEEGPTSATYTIVLGGLPTGTVVVTVDPEDDIEVDDAGEGVAVDLTFTTSDWDQEQTVTVTAIDDELSEGPEVAQIAHSASGGGYDSAIINSVSVTVADNEEYCGEPGQIYVDADIAGPDGVGDAFRDCHVNLIDLGAMANQWLDCTDRFLAECVQW